MSRADDLLAGVGEGPASAPRETQDIETSVFVAAAARWKKDAQQGTAACAPDALDANDAFLLLATNTVSHLSQLSCHREKGETGGRDSIGPVSENRPESSELGKKQAAEKHDEGAAGRDTSETRARHVPASATGKRHRTVAGNAGQPPAPRANGHYPQARATTAAGRVTGQNHPFARWPDAVVDEVRRLRATGLTFRAIAKAVNVPFSTVFGWCNGKRPEALRTAVYSRWRRTAARTAAKRKAAS